MAASPAPATGADGMTKSNDPAGQLAVPNATIVSCHPPDIPQDASIIGICAVPIGHEGNDKFGHHVADFLAWKHLFSNLSTFPDDQVWLSLANIGDAVRTHKYTHSGRDVTPVAQDSNRPIIFEPNPHALHGKFMSHLVKKAEMARQDGSVLVIIICGLTSPEQDIWLAQYKHIAVTITSGAVRAAAGPDTRVVLVSPAITSVGWQIDPSLNHPILVAACPKVFLGRRCGAIFSSKLVKRFLSEFSPLVNDQASNQFSIPLQKKPEMLGIESRLHARIHACLSGHFVSSKVHEFQFIREGDPWSLIGARKGMTLASLAQHWSSLNRVDISDTQAELGDGFPFLGNAFGGNCKSQLIHLDHMFNQGLSSPAYNSNNMGSVMDHYQQLRSAAETNEEDYRILFNTLEHRLSLVKVGDLVAQNLSPSSDFITRCRDWCESELESNEARDTRKVWTAILKYFPLADMPYGRRIDSPKGLFLILHKPLLCLANTVVARVREKKWNLDDGIAELIKLINELKESQSSLLALDPEVRELFRAWSKLCIAKSAPARQSDLSPLPLNKGGSLSSRHGVVSVPEPPIESQQDIPVFVFPPTRLRTQQETTVHVFPSTRLHNSAPVLNEQDADTPAKSTEVKTSTKGDDAEHQRHLLPHQRTRFVSLKRAEDEAPLAAKPTAIIMEPKKNLEDVKYSLLASDKVQLPSLDSQQGKENVEARSPGSEVESTMSEDIDISLDLPPRPHRQRSCFETSSNQEEGAGHFKKQSEAAKVISMKGGDDNHMQHLAHEDTASRELPLVKTDSVPATPKPAKTEGDSTTINQDDQSHLLPHERKGPWKSSAEKKQVTTHSIETGPIGFDTVEEDGENQSHLPPHLRKGPWRSVSKQQSSVSLKA